MKRNFKKRSKITAKKKEGLQCDCLDREQVGKEQQGIYIYTREVMSQICKCR